jgi:hypothetical protein
VTATDDPDPRAPYAWAESDDGYFNYTLTLVSSRTPTEVLSLVVPEPAVPVADAGSVVAWSQPDGSDELRLAVQAQAITPAWTLVVEDNGFQCSDADVLQRLSADGRTAVSFFYNVNAVARLLVARDGMLQRDVDPLLPDPEEAPLPEEDGIPFPGPGEELRPVSGSLAVMERLTGIRLAPDDLVEVDRPGRIAVGLIV